MNEINNMIKLKKESKERFEVANQILPKNAQQACIEAKIISAKVLKLIPYKTTNNKNSRGTMIKIANNKSQVFIFNSKKSISNIYVSDILRSLYYFFVYQTFFVENQNKYLLFVYMIYLRLWSRCINLKEYINNLSRNLSQYFLS